MTAMTLIQTLDAAVPGLGTLIPVLAAGIVATVCLVLRRTIATKAQPAPATLHETSKRETHLPDGGEPSMESMKLGLLGAIWLLVVMTAINGLEGTGVLEPNFFHGLLGTVFHYLGMEEQATHFFELYLQSPSRSG